MQRRKITGCLYYGCGVGNLEWSASYPHLPMRSKMNIKKRLEDMTVEELIEELLRRRHV